MRNVDTSTHGRWRRLFTARRRDELEADLLREVRRQQREWQHDRGYDEFSTGESCSRRFFEEVRPAKVHSHIHVVRLASGRRVRGTTRILREARCFFCGAGALFNLNPGGAVSEEQAEARRHLLDALRQDGKVLSDDQASRLRIENVFTPEVVQQAIDELGGDSCPGLDGWTADFFKVVGARVEDEDGEMVPSPLATLLAETYAECARPGGRLLDCMTESVVSLIYKEKGKREDLGKYRPIAVSSVIYRIMAKSMVIAIRPLLSSVTDACQKAFKPEELIADATRLVQDTIHYCESTDTPGFLLFADQDGAYPRVRWDYLLEVMRTMNFPESFISFVRTMYVDARLRFKVNGVIDRVAARPSNGLAQGCPLSPCLYLLCIQGLISLLNVDARSPEGLRGIAIPDEWGGVRADQPTVLLTSAFADDVCVFLHDSTQLVRFRSLLDEYCLGAGALNSWEKTVGLRVGAEKAVTGLPFGWKEGQDVSMCPTVKANGVEAVGVVRYLGIFLGVPEGVARVWAARTTGRIQQKAERWRERRPPATRQGRAVALRNSILAQAWYLVENQTPPRLSAMLEAWREEGWSFVAGSGGAAREEGCRGLTVATNVSHVMLLQDYAEGGRRIPDVEGFARALQVRKLRHMIEPHPAPHANFLLYWLDRFYGHLRQGRRLLISSCDFLQFDPGPEESKQAPLMWNYVLKAIGAMRGLQPAVDQKGAVPHVHYPEGDRAQGAGGRVRAPNCKSGWSLGEVVMEPLFYNPYLAGWWGAAIQDPPQWEVEQRLPHSKPKAHLVRWSCDRERRALEMFDATKLFADPLKAG